MIIEKDNEIIVDAFKEEHFVFPFKELSINAKYAAAQGLVEDSKDFEFDDGSDSIVGAYHSLKNDNCNLFNKDGTLISNGGGYL